MNKTGWDNKDVYDLGTGLANVLLVLSCIFLVIYSFAPLFGGKFLPMAFVKYGSWIGDAFVIKYVMKYVRDKTRMKKWKWYILSVWFVLSTFTWFPNYIGLIISVFFVTLLVGIYRSQGRAGWQNEY